MAVKLETLMVEDDSQLIELYKDRVNNLGFSSEALLYTSNIPHIAKMTQIARIVTRLVSEGDASTLDVGCGYGSLVEHLPRHIRYTGIDLVPEFVFEARRRHRNLCFLVGDVEVVGKVMFDVVIIAGVLSSVPEPRNLLSRAIKRSKKFIVFDLTIGERLRKGYEDLNRWSVAEAVSMAEELGLSNITVHDDGNVWITISASGIGHP